MAGKFIDIPEMLSEVGDETPSLKQVFDARTDERMDPEQAEKIIRAANRQDLQKVDTTIADGKPVKEAAWELGFRD